VGTGHVDFAQLHGHKQDFLFIHAGLGQDLPAGAGNKALAPKLQSIAADRLLQTDAVDRRDIATIGHRV